VRIAIVVALAGCYTPRDYTCAIECDPTAQELTCPSELTCGTNGLCKPQNAADCPKVVASDASIDGALSASAICVGDYFRVCIDPAPTASLELLPGRLIRTNLDTECTIVQSQAGGPEVCVLAGINVSITGMIRAQGQRPLAIVATGVNGSPAAGRIVFSPNARVDLSSNGMERGAGSGSGDCPPAAVGEAGAAGGGGAGGALLYNGGPGGKGDDAAGGVITIATASIERVRGGCGGGSGGLGTVANGRGGFGGGSVHFLASGAIQVQANVEINASGAGGGAPKAHGGGGGGGSGGFIGFEVSDATASSYMIDPTARIFAIGGSGASGATLLPGMPGYIAIEPTDTVNGPPGPGGFGGAGSSTNGGNGGSSSERAVGGGGGGGSGGAIGFFAVAPPASVTIRPNPVVLP
jgi:hypothetical protein